MTPSPDMTETHDGAGGMSRVGWASRPPCCASRAAPGERPTPYERLPVFGCIPRDAEYGRRDAHPTRDMPSCFQSDYWYEMV